MKKILLAFDGSHFSEGAFEFARKLNALEPVLLAGIFLPQTHLSNLWSYADGMGGSVYIPLVEGEESELVSRNMERFEMLCSENNIEHCIHKDFFDFALPQLKNESRYADLLILGSEVFYKEMGTGSVNNFLEDALHDVECPVIVVPEKFDFPKNIILAYDGSYESVFAIKQFAYLFPELTGHKAFLVYADDDPTHDFPGKTKMEELVTRHYKDLTLMKLDIDPSKYFSTWVNENKSSLLVSGSYGRSGLSKFFKKSFAKDIIARHCLPVFIAHK